MGMVALGPRQGIEERGPRGALPYMSPALSLGVWAGLGGTLGEG